MKPHQSLAKRHACSLIIILLSATAVLPQAGWSRGVGVKVRVENGEVVNLYEESHALVIGVSNYTNGWRSLPGVKRDVEAIESILRTQGFKVETIVNPKGRDLDQAIKDFIARNGQAFGNRLLIYFAGHGETLKTSDGREVGYIVPADAPLASSNLGQFKQTAISMNMIENYALMIESKHALFVFDCCFSGSLFETNRAGSPPAAITARIALPVRQVITAGTAEQEVPDHSIFREQFVEALNGKADRNGDGYITGSELGEFLEDNVTNYSRGAQTPRWGKIRNSNLDKGNFVFVLPTNTGGLITPAPAGTDEVKHTGVPAPTVSGSGGQLCAGVLMLIASSRKGFHDIVGEPTSKNSAYSFKSTLTLPEATSSRISPDNSVEYRMAESDNVGDVASEYYKLVNKLTECLPAWQQKQEDPPPNGSLSFKRNKFRERKNGVIIEVHYLKPMSFGTKLPSKHFLYLTVYKPGIGYW
jgi:hypothetical protein